MKKNEALEATAGRTKRTEHYALEARPVAEVTDTGPKGDNFMVCPEPSCRTLLWCERPGGHGEFDVVDSVACSKCEIKTYYCIPCAERLGWQLMRKSAMCPACAVEVRRKPYKHFFWTTGVRRAFNGELGLRVRAAAYPALCVVWLHRR